MTLFILISVLLTSTLSGVLGMAGGMVLMGALTWVLPVSQAMVLHGVAQFFANSSRALIHRHHVHMKSAKYYMAGMCISLALFCAVVFTPDKFIVFLLLGVSSYMPSLLRGRAKLDFTRPRHALFCGIVVTASQLMAGVGGPLLNLFFQKIPMTRYEVVATKAFAQAVTHVVKILYFSFVVAHVAMDATPLPTWMYAAVIPTAIFGSYIATHMLNRISDAQFYKATQWLIWVVGAVYLVKAATLTR